MNLSRLRSLFKAFQCKYREISLAWSIDNFKSAKWFNSAGNEQFKYELSRSKLCSFMFQISTANKFTVLKEKKELKKKKKKTISEDFCCIINFLPSLNFL